MKTFLNLSIKKMKKKKSSQFNILSFKGCILRPFLLFFISLSLYSNNNTEIKKALQKIVNLKIEKINFSTNFIKSVAPQYGIEIIKLKEKKLKWIQRNLKILYANNICKTYKKFYSYDIMQTLNTEEDLKKTSEYYKAEQFLYLGFLEDIKNKLIPKLIKKA